MIFFDRMENNTQKHVMLRKFSALAESLLLEMPHISYETTTVIDLELETYSPTKEGYDKLVENIKKFLNHEPLQSKRSEVTYQLPEGEDNKQSFIDALMNDNILKLWLKKNIQKTLDEFLLDINVSDTEPTTDDETSTDKDL